MQCVKRNRVFQYTFLHYTNVFVFVLIVRVNWASSVRNLLYRFGFGFVWISQDVKTFLKVFRQRVIGPGHAKTCLNPYVNNKGADEPAHPRNLISTCVVRCLDSMICILALIKIQDSS